VIGLVFVTTTFAGPAPACARVVAAIVVAFTTVTPVAATPPIVTVALGTKLEPVIVTAVPPLVDPVEGEIDVTDGGVTKGKPPAGVPVWLSGFVPTPWGGGGRAACAPVVAVIVVAVTTTLPASTPPMVTVAPLEKPLPVIVTAVPPSVDPDDGEI